MMSQFTAHYSVTRNPPPQTIHRIFYIAMQGKKCRFFLVRYSENGVRMCVTHCCEFMIPEKNGLSNLTCAHSTSYANVMQWLIMD